MAAYLFRPHLRFMTSLFPSLLIIGRPQCWCRHISHIRDESDDQCGRRQAGSELLINHKLPSIGLRSDSPPPHPKKADFTFSTDRLLAWWLEMLCSKDYPFWCSILWNVYVKQLWNLKSRKIVAVFDCRWQVKHVSYRSNWSTATVISCRGGLTATVADALMYVSVTLYHMHAWRVLVSVSVLSNKKIGLSYRLKVTYSV